MRIMTDAPWWARYQVHTLPVGEQGAVKIERFEVSEDASRFDALRSGSRSVPAGTYTRLKERHTLWMSDTPAEIRDHREIIRRAEGEVLIQGLGIGLVARACAMKSKVRSVTVVEQSPDIIALVEPWLRECADSHDTRLEVILGDALALKHPKGKRWNCVWHDIWPNICADNAESMSTLHRRFARRCDWQGSWARGLVKAAQQRERKEASAWGRYS